MANKKINELDSRASLSLSDLLAVGDPTTGYLYKITITDLKSLTGAGVISFNGRVGSVVPAEGDYSLNQLSDVIITTAANGNIVKYNGSNWVNVPMYTGTIAQYVDGTGAYQTFPTLLSSDRLLTEVRNTTGATVTKGTVIYLNGSSGTLPTIAKAQANSEATSSTTYGVVQNDIANNANGYVVVIGNLTGIDTSAYNAGDILWLSPTVAGGYTTTKPSAPNNSVYIGIVTRSNNTAGTIEVKIQNGYELDELHNVAISSVANNQVLVYESSSTLWKNKSIATILGFTPISLSSLSASAPLSYNSGTGAFSISQATTSTDGYLSSTDWNTFNGKQNALTNPVTGTGVSGRVAYFNGTTSQTSSANLTWDNTDNRLGIGLTNPQRSLEIYSATADSHLRLSGAAPTVSMGEAVTGAVYQAKFGLVTVNAQFVTGSLAGDFVIISQTGATIWATSGGEKMRLTSGGNLGIGTTAPSYPLHVYSTTSARAAVVGTTNFATFNAANTSGAFYFGIDDSAGTNFTSAAYGRFLYSSGAYPMVFFTDATERMRILSTGNVGIGTTTPGRLLNVSGGGTDGTQLQINGTVDSAGIKLIPTTGNNWEIQANTSSQFFIYNRTNSYYALTIASTGAATFSSSVQSTQLTINSGASNNYINFIQNSTNIGYVGDANWIFGGTISDFGIRATNNLVFGIGASEKMRISSTGNVGIGTSTPTSPLHIGNTTSGNQKIQQWGEPGFVDNYGLILRGSSLDGVFKFYGLNNGTETTAPILSMARSSGNVGIGTASPLSALDKTFTVFGTGIFQTTEGAGNYNENLRLNRNTGNGYASIALGGAYNSTAGTGTGQWTFSATPVALSYRLDFDYNGSTKGYIDPSTGAYVALSDKNQKKDFEDSTIGLNAILGLKPTLYRMKDEQGTEKQLGFIAQEVKDFIPHAYSETVDGFIGLQDRPIIAALVKAIHELNTEINTLKNK